MGIIKTIMFKSEFKKLKRKEKAQLITKAVLKHILIRGHGLKIGLPEINVNIGKNKNNLRIDVLELYKNKPDLIGYEIKSCIQDFRTDNKWESYLGLVNCLYFVFDEETFEKYEEEIRNKINNKAGIYVYSCERDWIWAIEHTRCYETNNPENIYQVMLFNYLLRTQNRST